MRRPEGDQDGRAAAAGVTLDRPVACMRCGTETSGPATCPACHQAIDELRGLAADPRPWWEAGLWLSDRAADLR